MANPTTTELEEIAREIVDQLKAEWKSQDDKPLIAANMAAPQVVNVDALDRLSSAGIPVDIVFEQGVKQLGL